MRWQKEKDPLSPWRADGTRGFLSPFVLFGIMGVLLTAVSFLLWQGNAGTGDIGRAASFFEDFFEENDAIAVFLGWEGE